MLTLDLALISILLTHEAWGLQMLRLAKELQKPEYVGPIIPFLACCGGVGHTSKHQFRSLQLLSPMSKYRTFNQHDHALEAATDLREGPSAASTHASQESRWSITRLKPCTAPCPQGLQRGTRWGAARKSLRSAPPDRPGQIRSIHSTCFRAFCHMLSEFAHALGAQLSCSLAAFLDNCGDVAGSPTTSTSSW